MPTQVSSIFRQHIRNLDKLNLFTLITHERAEQGWGYLEHEFYAWGGQNNVRTWNTNVSLPPLNYHILPFGQLPNHIELDLCISQSPDIHLPICKQISNHFRIPIIQVWHTFPQPNYPKFQKKQLRQVFDSFVNVFISEDNRQEWGFGDCPNAYVIWHGIDIEYWKPSAEVQKKNHILSVNNDFINRNWCLGFDLFRQTVGLMSNQQLPITIVGNTPGLSNPSKSQDDMLKIYQEHTIYLNTTLYSPISMALLEAMACGLCCISTKQGLAGKIIQHGYNGLLCDPDPRIMRQHCIEMLNEPTAREEMGKNARKTIQEMFSVNNYVENWNKIFKIALGE
jgi:glycosyltransferase involved in cell wall biosynthesis